MLRDLDVVRVLVISLLPVSDDLRRVIGREFSRLYARPWLLSTLRRMALYGALPVRDNLPITTCFKLWCGHLKLEQLEVPSKKWTLTSDGRPQRAETLILLGDRVIYRSFHRPGLLD